MSGTPNPSLNITELNGNLRTVIDTGEGTILKMGTGSAYLRGVPVRCGSQPAVNAFGVGTLVSDSGPHIEFCNRSLYAVQVDASTPGTIGAVVKMPSTSPTSPSSLALSAATFSGRTNGNPLPGGAALNITSGFADPPSPLAGIIVIGAGGVAHTATWVYYNEAGTLKTDIIAISGVGTFGTTGRIKQSVSYSTYIDPVGTTTLSFAYAGPLDRFDHILFNVIRPGQITVSSAQQAQVQYSFDDGVTYSPAVTVPSTGIVDLYTYPGGFTRWHTGIRATFTQGSVSQTLYGAYRAAGATADGDTVWTFAAAGASIQVVQPTVPTAAFLFSNVGSAVTLTCAATGGAKASLTFSGNLDCKFEVQTVGTGGNAITVATVADGVGAGTAGVVGNVITIHYQDGVTTVTQVKSHFPLAATFGSVTATGGTGANVLAAPGDTHAATNLAGGVNATASTGAAIKAFFDTDVSAPTLAAKLYINRVTTVGTGLGLAANAGPGTAANGAISWTGLKPGVRVRHLVSGNNTAEDITVAALDVTVVSATDANGAETSTPNSVLATLASKPTIAALLSGAVSGTGAGIIGNWDYVALPMSLELDDQWSSYTTPPQMTLSDLQAVWQTLRTTYLKTLSNIEAVDICQDNIDNATYQAFVSWILGIKNDKKLPLWGMVRGLYRIPQVTTDENLWALAAVAALPSPRNTTVAYHCGEVDTLVSLYGCQMAKNFATLADARVMNVIISQSPSQVRCLVRSADGTQFAVPGSGLHSVHGGTDEKTALWEGDDALLVLHAENVITPTNIPKKDGVFIRQSLIYCDDGSPFIFEERRRVMNRAWNVTFATLINILNANLLTNKNDGTLAEIEAQQIERSVIAALNSGGLLNDNGVNHVSAFDFSVSRLEQTAVTFNVSCALTIVPLAKAVTISETIGFAVTIGSGT